jgi:hypothetical protein
MRGKLWFRFVLTLVLVLLTAAAAAASPQAQPSPTDRHRQVVGDDVADTAAELDRLHPRQHGGAEGHLPPTRRNVKLVGKVRMADAAPGRIADVGAFGNYAYLAAYAEPTCERGGVYVVDISDPRRPREVGFIATAEGSFVGEGVQVVRLKTRAFRGDVLVHNNEICSDAPTAIGGMSLWDVTDPTSPQPLALGVGDTTIDGQPQPRANMIHSVFIWQQGRRAYAVIVDDEEAGARDVDILDITDPRQPVLIAETGIVDWPDAQSPLARGDEVFFHDVVVKRVRGTWTMLLSYWDVGWVLLDVDDPANPSFIADSDFPDPEPLTGFSPPEGNAHQAEWNKTNRWIIGTSEDFSPFRAFVNIGDRQFPANQGSGSPPLTDTTTLEGPTTFVGLACDPATVPQAPAPGTIALVERGECFFQDKADNVVAKGYAAMIIFNSANPDCEEVFTPAVETTIPVLFVSRSTGFAILGQDPGADVCTTPTGAEIGAAGATVRLSAQFDGWGHVHLLDARTLQQVDAYAVREALDPRYATRFGDLSVHEVATDPDWPNVAYLSYYNAGFRVIRIDRGRIREVGRFIDEGGNDFWGVEVHRLPGKGRRFGKLVLASDRDYGLYIFKYTGRH